MIIFADQLDNIHKENIQKTIDKTIDSITDKYLQCKDHRDILNDYGALVESCTEEIKKAIIEEAEQGVYSVKIDVNKYCNTTNFSRLFYNREKLREIYKIQNTIGSIFDDSIHYGLRLPINSYDLLFCICSRILRENRNRGKIIDNSDDGDNSKLILCLKWGDIDLHTKSLRQKLKSLDITPERFLE